MDADPRTAPAHLAMFSIAAHGHVQPSLEVVRELVARGHRVSYAIPESFAGLVAAAGAEPKVYRTTLPADGDDPAAWGTTLIDNVEPFFNDAVSALPQLTALFEDGPGGGSEDGPEGGGGLPELVLSDIASYPSRVLAYRWGVPHVQLSPCMVAWKGYVAEEVVPEFAEMKASERGAAYYARFRDWLAGNGVDQDPDDFMGRPDRSIVLIPRALQPNAELVDEEIYTFVGACQGDRGGQGNWQRPEAAEGKKVLLVSLGSTFTNEPAFYRACVEAFGDLPGWHVVLQIGRHVDPAELGHVPGNVEVHNWVPQLDLLRQADAFVTHAGAGGCQEGLATGTPMIAVPQAADQFGNAAILEGLGVARHVPKEEATAARLRAALDELTGDPQVAVRGAEIQEGMSGEGGTKLAADLIEEELRRARG